MDRRMYINLYFKYYIIIYITYYTYYTYIYNLSPYISIISSIPTARFSINCIKFFPVFLEPLKPWDPQFWPRIRRELVSQGLKRTEPCPINSLTLTLWTYCLQLKNNSAAAVFSCIKFRCMATQRRNSKKRSADWCRWVFWLGKNHRRACHGMLGVSLHHILCIRRVLLHRDRVVAFRNQGAPKPIGNTQVGCGINLFARCVAPSATCIWISAEGVVAGGAAGWGSLKNNVKELTVVTSVLNYASAFPHFLAFTPEQASAIWLGKGTSKR